MIPIMSCRKNGKPGYKFGKTGTCYTYTPNDPASKARALARARAQERAIRAQGWTE